MEMDLKPIRALDEQAQAQAKRRWDAVAKPLHSLGALEDLITQIAGIEETADVVLSPRCVLVFCADHGVVAEGISQSESEVTSLVAGSIAQGSANVNLMADISGADVFAVDMGMKREQTHPGIIVRRQGCGTDNMTRGPAMRREQAIGAIKAGIDLTSEMKARGYRMVATGEMGIGNTTASTAIACALLCKSPQDLTGRGAGLSDAGLLRKRAAIERALAVNCPKRDDPLDVLCKVGGFEIAGMVGAFLGGAIHRMPVVIDGVISGVAALLAMCICPAARDYMLPSHRSGEPAGGLILDALHMRPVVEAGMALGEGTGAVTLFPLLDMALRVYKGTHTFGQLGMDPYTPQGGKE